MSKGGEWVFVEHNKPEAGDVVLLWDEDRKTYALGEWDESFGQFHQMGMNPDYCNPSHWRELPEPPR